MATTCRIEINDYHNDLEECRTLKLAVKYPTLAAATAAASVGQSSRRVPQYTDSSGRTWATSSWPTTRHDI